MDTELSVRSKLPIVNPLLRAPTEALSHEFQEAEASWSVFGDFLQKQKVTPSGERAAPVQTIHNKSSLEKLYKNRYYAPPAGVPFSTRREKRPKKVRQNENLLKRRTSYVFADPMSPTDSNPWSSGRGQKNRPPATELSVRSKLPIVNLSLSAPTGAPSPWRSKRPKPFGILLVTFPMQEKLPPAGSAQLSSKPSKNISYLYQAICKFRFLLFSLPSYILVKENGLKGLNR